MQTRLFELSSYLDPGEQFHFARKALESRRPPFRHTHDYYELFLVEQGDTQHFINGRTEVLARGALVFIRPRDAHAFCAGPNGCQIINIMFHSATADHLAQRYGAELGARFFWAPTQGPDTHHLRGPRMERAINSALELQTAHRSLARVEAFLLFIMTRVVDFSATLPIGTPAWLVTACADTRDPQVFRQGAAGFVAAAGRGHEHVCRVARQYLGLSPTAYVNRVRMEHAAMLLGGTDQPIPDIAVDCGLENLSHFYRLFQSHYGTTPRRYRARHLSDPVQP